MSHHHTEKKANDFNLYYLVGLVSGILTAACIEITFLSIVIGAVVGLLFTALFVNVLVKGRVDA
ncbi:hypothetical protein HQ865_22185 [Mucilaginibacter mali]|uniref:Uncharacterized protein n=1 Tax=Mucilaginibacter mali TaxID=2740462 RepID=A0A7D4TQ48_9SPHI|nr:hypothetical protein [Mucilaginibacter mali]QKJ32353.1 hypothetical protein HQ865_22185 [Mucilaginibacter mali]